MAGPIRIAVVSDVSQGVAGVNAAGRSVDGFGAKARKVGKVAAVGLGLAGAGLIKLGISSVKSASDAQQSLGATETVFGKFSNRVVKTSKTAAKSVGLSANAYRESSNLIGALLANQGVSQDKLAGKTRKLVKTGADLAATFGGPTSKAVEALGSAYKGEFDPLEAYGISLKQSTVNTEALGIANVKTQAAFDKLSTAQQTAAKQQATTNLVQKQSAKSAGAFARETNTLANQQQVAGAQVENLKTKIGNALLPVLTSGFTVLNNKVLPPLTRFAETQLPKASAAVADFIGSGDPGEVFGKIRDGFAGIDFAKIGSAFGELGSTAKQLGPSLKAISIDQVNNGLTVFGTVAEFAADHAGLLKAALPFLVAGFVALKTAQAANAVAGRNSVIGFGLQIASTLSLTASNKALAKSQQQVTVSTASATTAENTGALARARGTVATIASTVASKAAAAASKAWAIAQGALNVVLTANPIGLVIVAIAGLVAGFVIAYKKSDKFRAVVNKAFSVIKSVVIGAVKAVVSFVKKNWAKLLPLIGGPIGAVAVVVIKNWDKIKAATSAVFNAVRSVISSVIGFVKTYISTQIRIAKTVVTGAWNAVKTATTRTWGAVKTAVTKAVTALLDAVSGIKSKVTGALAGAGSLLLDAGKAIIQGLIDGVTSKIGALKSKLGSITKLIPDIKGPPSKDKRLLRPAGRLIMAGLVDGLDDGTAKVRTTLQGLTKKIAKDVTGPGKSLDLAVSATLDRPGGPPAPVIDVMNRLDQLIRLLERLTSTSEHAPDDLAAVLATWLTGQTTDGYRRQRA